MEGLLPLLILACPVGMGLMMWIMARGMGGKKKEESAGPQASVADLRHEQERISARIEELETDDDAEPKLAHR